MCSQLPYYIPEYIQSFLANRILTVTLACYSVASVVCRRLPVMLCTVAKWCVLEQKLLLTAYRKSYMGNRLVPKSYERHWLLFRGRLRPCQPLRHIRHWIFWKPLEIEAWFQRTTNRKWPTGNRDRWRHVALKGQTRDPICLEPNISNTAGDSIMIFTIATIASANYQIVCCEAVRSAILATAWFLADC